MLKSATLLALATAAAARKCQDLVIPISISAQNAVFNIQAPTTQIDVTNLFLDITVAGQNYTEKILTGYKTVSGNYKIAATYCQPDKGPGKALQVLTHGVGFDRRYWDIPYANYNYSYVARAVDEQGYSTFTWDRLGVGASSKGEPINEIQQFLEIAALTELSYSLRNGTISGIHNKFDKFVHIGHSFGSAITYNFINNNPDFSEAAILTGFGQNFNFATGFLLGGDYEPVKQSPLLAAKYPVGYLAPLSKIGVHTQFFAPGDFDPKMLDYIFSISQAATPGEFLTNGVGLGAKNAYKGHLFIVTGDRDLPFCGANCQDASSINFAYPDLLASSKPFFPSAATFNTSIIPGAGHGLTSGYSAKATYDSMFSFLKQYC
ncbi:hypothetical protein Trco_006057 [Trichoderma cornu-damae]|uniref:AB hydrolase-1 domain-containing protein n=1 Tax=Trichoderma cornu-damae TaxID=654480 RepID=A0A9P8TVT6_9HYPO|nr:hypothetical protein Trco_006057 [Trichoderma cornu-damae]